MKSQSLALQVYEELRKQILIGQLQANMRLKEDFWAKKLNVSRVVVRESLTRLLGEGLLRAGEKGGFFVTKITANDIKQIREIREILELGALKIGIEKVTKEHIKELLNICDDFTALSKKGYLAGACEVDIKFHQALISISENTRLINAYHFSHIPLFHQRVGRTTQYYNDFDLTDREHREIVAAIKSKNLVLAQKLLKAHFDRGVKWVLEMD